VAGVEKMGSPSRSGDGRFWRWRPTRIRSSVIGLSSWSLNALLMRRYMHEYGVPHETSRRFAINAQ